MNSPQSFVTDLPAGRTPGVVRDLQWSVEELRGLAVQLQLPDASRKTRCELLELLAGIDSRDA